MRFWIKHYMIGLLFVAHAFSLKTGHNQEKSVSTTLTVCGHRPQDLTLTLFDG